MARTNAQKRAARLETMRVSQAARRAQMKVVGRPDTGRIDGALAEAMSFAVSTLGLAAMRGEPAPDVMALITDTAVDLLVRREGYDRRQTKLALRSRLAPRPEHLEPSYVPSLRPDPAAQDERIMSLSTPPLVHQTASTGGS